MYTRDENYLSIFSKEELELYLLGCFPKAADLASEKRKARMKAILTLDHVAPNTLLALEG